MLTKGRAATRIVALLAGTALAGAASASDWLQFNRDSAHSGSNAAETILDAGNVASLTQKFQISLPNTADGAPVFLEGVATAGGVRDLLFVTTKDGWIAAVDAATGASVWSHQNGPGNCVDSNGSICYTTSSPAIDPNRQFVYSYGLDGNAHKYQVADGTEILTGGWPQVTTRKGQTEKGSSALAIAASAGVPYLYVTHGGYPGDLGDYQGHVTAINLATGTQNVFNAMCSAQTIHFTLGPQDCGGTQTAVWSRPGVIYDAGTDRIFLGTGNSLNGGYNGSGFWSESVLALHPDGTGSLGMPVDAFTPASHQSLDSSDADLGSTAPAILPAPPNSNVPHLAVQGGKDQLLRLINLANLSGQGGPGHVGGEVQTPFSVPQGGAVLSQPAVWVNPADATTWVFVGTNGGVSGLRLAVDGSGNPSLVLQWKDSTHGQATSPIVANGVVYTFGSGVVRARAATTGAILYTSGALGGTHWQSPIVVNGALYVTDNASHLVAFALPSSPPAFTSASSAAFQLGVAGSFVVRATGAPTPTLAEAGAMPGGVTFTAATGTLAGTPSATGSFPLQFTASNGVAPDATQNFTLTVNSGPPPQAMLTFTDPACTSFGLTGTPPTQTLTCIGGGGGGGVPICAPTASPAAPAVGQQATISANCSNQPNPNGYVWTGGTCGSNSSPTCTVTKARAMSITYTVSARNAAGAGPPASITVSWH